MDRKPEDLKDLADWRRRVRRVEESGATRAPAFNNNRPPPNARTLQTPEKTPSTSQTRQQFLPTPNAGSEYISSFAAPAPILPESVLTYAHHRRSSDYQDGSQSALPSLRQSINNISQQERQGLYQKPHHQRSDMATMTMHAVHGQPQATWEPRERTRSQEFGSDAMTLPPIRQAVPEIDMRPLDNQPRYSTDRVVPTIEGEGSSPTYYSPPSDRRREERYPPSQYQGAPMYQQQPMYRTGPYPGEYTQSQYPEPQYDQRVPGYGRPPPQYMSEQAYADPRARVMVQQPTYAPQYHPQDSYRHAHQEVYHQMSVPLQNGDGGKNGPQRKRRGNLPKETTDKLRNWFHSHLHHPYPTEDEKQELMMLTGLQMNQISNWFINARRRQLPQLLNEQKSGAKGVSNGTPLQYAQKGDGRHYEDEDEDESEEDDEYEEDARHSAKKNGKL